MNIAIWILIGLLLGVLISKYWKFPIYLIFWILGWNDSRKAKKWNNGGRVFEAVDREEAKRIYQVLTDINS